MKTKEGGYHKENTFKNSADMRKQKLKNLIVTKKLKGKKGS